MVAACRQAAAQIAEQVAEQIAGRTTVSVERSVTRLLGVDGANDLEAPLPNVLVDHVHDGGGLGRGIAYWLGNAMLQTGRSPQQIAEARQRAASSTCARSERAPRRRRSASASRRSARRGCARSPRASSERRAMRERLGDAAAPLRYVLTATGDVYEDVVHAKAVARGRRRHRRGDPLDRAEPARLRPLRPDDGGLRRHVRHAGQLPHHARGDGRVVEQHGRYVRLSSFCSGLCMSEIAAMGAWEGFDNMVNDALYGILYRDINIVRGLIDQRVSRMINGYFGVVINTGEDNYLRTADAIEAAPSVTASQFINHQLARDSGVPDAQIALGDAFEIDVPVKNGLLYEWAQAQLTRELFPDCPVKYMPPTRHMDGNLFRTHAADTLFNLVTIATGQGIQTIGVPTEGIFTPHIHDRVLGLQNVDYVFNAAHDLGEEIEFKRGGIIQTRAQEVLAGAHELLERIAQTGLFAGDRGSHLRRRQPQARRGPRDRGDRRDRGGLLQPGRRADARRAARPGEASYA